jgi:hypothetical protein
MRARPGGRCAAGPSWLPAVDNTTGRVNGCLTMPVRPPAVAPRRRLALPPQLPMRHRPAGNEGCRVFVRRCQTAQRNSERRTAGPGHGVRAVCDLLPAFSSSLSSLTHLPSPFSSPRRTRRAYFESSRPMRGADGAPDWRAGAANTRYCAPYTFTDARERACDRRAGACEAPRIRAKDARLSALHRGDFWAGLRFASSAFRAGSCLRTGHRYPRDRSPGLPRPGCKPSSRGTATPRSALQERPRGGSPHERG